MFDARTHFYCSFDVQFPTSPEAGWDRTLDVSRTWLRKKFQHFPDLVNLDGKWFKEGTDRPQIIADHRLEIATVSETENTPRIWSLSYQHDDVDWEFRKWKTEISLTMAGENIRFTLRLTHFVADDWVGHEPALPVHSIPGIVSSFIKDGNAYSGGVKLRQIPITVKAENAVLFKQFLEEKQRVLPVVLVSKTWSGETLVNPRVLARSLASIAFVCEVPDELSDIALAQVLPQDFRTFAGAVRLYLPNVDTSKPNDAFRHRYFRFSPESPQGESVEALIARAALRRIALQNERQLITVSDARLTASLQEAKARADDSVLVEALQQQVAALKRISNDQAEQYVNATLRAERAEGQLASLEDDLRSKNYQYSQLLLSFQARAEFLDDGTPKDKLLKKLDDKSVAAPIICIRSKQDSSYLDLLSDSLGVAREEL
jgi:hypothetical protein